MPKYFPSVPRKFRLSASEDAAIAAILTNAKVDELGEEAYFPRISTYFAPNPHPELGGREKILKHSRPKKSAIEIAMKASQRAADRFAREMEGVYH